jgi:hypothetical protein
MGGIANSRKGGGVFEAVDLPLTAQHQQRPRWDSPGLQTSALEAEHETVLANQADFYVDSQCWHTSRTSSTSNYIIPKPL